MVCIFFFAIFCCIPIVALVYAVATRQGASADDIRNLPKYRYRLASHLRASNNSEKQDVFGTETEMSNSNSTDELALHPEDSVSIYKHFCAQFWNVRFLMKVELLFSFSHYWVFWPTLIMHSVIKKEKKITFNKLDVAFHYCYYL